MHICDAAFKIGSQYHVNILLVVVIDEILLQTLAAHYAGNVHQCCKCNLPGFLADFNFNSLKCQKRNCATVNRCQLKFTVHCLN